MAFFDPLCIELAIRQALNCNAPYMKRLMMISGIPIRYIWPHSRIEHYDISPFLKYSILNSVCHVLWQLDYSVKPNTYRHVLKVYYTNCECITWYSYWKEISVTTGFTWRIEVWSPLCGIMLSWKGKMENWKGQKRESFVLKSRLVSCVLFGCKDTLFM